MGCSSGILDMTGIGGHPLIRSIRQIQVPFSLRSSPLDTQAPIRPCLLTFRVQNFKIVHFVVVPSMDSHVLYVK